MSDEVVIHTAQGDLEAEQVCSFLNANGIETHIRGEALRLTHGFTLDGLGQVEVLVRADQVVAARELMDQVANGALALPEEHEG